MNKVEISRVAVKVSLDPFILNYSLENIIWNFYL